MEEISVVLGCPISNREKILPYYLENVHSLEFNRKKLSLYFIINNSQDDSEKIIKKFKLDHEHEYHNITIDYYYGNRNSPHDQRTNEIRLKHTYNHLSILRNKLLEYTEKNNHSHLLSLDSDIMIKPDTLTKLLSHKKDCIAGLIWNGFEHAKTDPWKFPNILNYNNDNILKHISNYYVKNAPTLTESKLVKVDCSGAIILLSNRLCKSGIQYGWDVQGEDIFFSREVYKKGFEIFCDYSCYNPHLMNEELLQQYIESKNKVLV